MAANIAVKDSAGADTVLKTTDNTGVHTPHHNIDKIAVTATYLGGETITTTGSSQTCTIPAGTEFFTIDAEDADVHYEINPAGDASASSPGYVPSGNCRIGFPISNLTSLKVFLDSSAIAHIQYYKETA